MLLGLNPRFRTKDFAPLLDKFVGGDKIPKISGEGDWADTVGAKTQENRSYESNPSVSQPREEPYYARV
jgi:hypothetical protein